MIEQETILELSTQEKLQIMELLWKDLSRDESSLEIPEWQKHILDHRMARIESGEAHYRDWDTVRQNVLKMVDEDSI